MLSQISLDKNKKLAPRDSLGVFNAFIKGKLPICISFLRPLFIFFWGTTHSYYLPSLPLASPQRQCSSLSVLLTPAYLSPKALFILISFLHSSCLSSKTLFSLISSLRSFPALPQTLISISLAPFSLLNPAP